ncbi:hypothetical protein C3747_23g151 [Trypanosoma cruzi]|uniref:Uncharacterized protein n=2 Tax=Trypanosoma cruzi TaxID=5693 RepID=Q4DCF6_TRYCC|nr:hypothetical protein, conserved [Trypanosoma cruzi]EAN90212.1 hypothetical protein, conserved [Trypanosoma cruzi]PWV16486.1 hypothetical protein C3747_23g151 [Trypanosoma cruzi]RNC45162.1 hypothetical protein TcCL_NonESM05119 [Trypanosoma cruzi]|eukprot:XP_812063.1 hypothetical protein [Trypanosoma cruzi strain CL Brener]
MNKTDATNGCSVFRVLFAPVNGSARQRRRWLCGRMYVGFDRTTLVDEESHKTVCVVSGTGIRSNAVYAMMRAASNGAAWEVGTELSLKRYAVQIEEAMHLHLLPYATFDGGGKREGGDEEEEAAVRCWSDDDDYDRTAGISRMAVGAAEVLTPCHVNQASPVSTVTIAASACTVTTENVHGNFLRQRRLSHELLRELENAYPHFFA